MGIPVRLDFNKEEFGNRLAEARINSHFESQKEFALSIGMDPKNYSAFEKGKKSPGSHYLIQMANELNVSPNYLLGAKEELSVADIAKALMALYFYEGVKMTEIPVKDEYTGHPKKAIQITIKQGDIRRILVDFLHHGKDRKPPQEVFEDMKAKLEKLEPKDAWSEKDVEVWERTVKRMTGWNDRIGISELALKKFFYGGTLKAENDQSCEMHRLMKIKKHAPSIQSLEDRKKYFLNQGISEQELDRLLYEYQQQIESKELQRKCILSHFEYFSYSKIDDSVSLSEAIEKFLKVNDLTENELLSYLNEIGISNQEYNLLKQNGGVLNGKPQTENE